jgi:two-component system sensor histidine kinase PilS (NtrC family)
MTQERRAEARSGARDRRRTDRRASDAAADNGSERRQAPGGAAAQGAVESWFGGLPDDRADSATAGPRLARAGDSPANNPFQRLYRLFVGARAVVGLALLLAQVAGALFGVRAAFPPLLLSLAYAAQALVMWLLPRFKPQRGEEPNQLTRGQWLSTMVVDVLAFSVLHLLEIASAFNYVALLVLPVLMSGVLMPRLTALGTAAGVTLLLLVGAWRGALAGGDIAVLLTQAGLAGTGFFVITLLSGELAGRLAREQRSARGSLELARQQAQLNRLVIEQMADGVLVIDKRTRVRAANPAARRLLVAQGLAPPAPFPMNGVGEWAALTQAVTQAFDAGGWPESGQDVALGFDGGQTRTLRLRGRFTGRRAEDGLADPAASTTAAEELCVLFIDDLRNVQARTRQEKLAAMGRVSAGIAHEIRNPLAAIAQANALLQEDAVAPDQQRLTRIVADNVARLKRIVDDVLEVAPGAEPGARTIDAGAEVAAATAEWARTVQVALGAASRLHVSLPSEAIGASLLAQPVSAWSEWQRGPEGGAPLNVLFDPDHLRRVLVNLLDNAHRHASGEPGAIELELARDGDEHASLSVASDGPPIAPDVERHLFEPFFSTRSRGTGLGLYICRELCERYGASIEYRLRPPGQNNRNQFLVTMLLASSRP